MKVGDQFEVRGTFGKRIMTVIKSDKSGVNALTPEQVKINNILMTGFHFYGRTYLRENIAAGYIRPL